MKKKWETECSKLYWIWDKGLSCHLNRTQYFFSFYSIFSQSDFPLAAKKKSNSFATRCGGDHPPGKYSFGGETADDVIRRKRCYAIRCGQGMPMIFSPPLFFLGSVAPVGPAHKNSKFRVHFWLFSEIESLTWRNRPFFKKNLCQRFQQFLKSKNAATGLQQSERLLSNHSGNICHWIEESKRHKSCLFCEPSRKHTRSTYVTKLSKLGDGTLTYRRPS